MNYSLLNKIIQNPNQLNDLDPETLQKWVLEQPHLAILKLLLAKKNNQANTDDSKSVIQNAAFYVPNRLKLHHFLKDEPNYYPLVEKIEANTIIENDLKIDEIEIGQITNILSEITNELEPIETLNLENELLENKTIINPISIEKEDKNVPEKITELETIESIALENATEEIVALENPILVEKEVEIIAEELNVIEESKNIHLENEWVENIAIENPTPNEKAEDNITETNTLVGRNEALKLNPEIIENDTSNKKLDAAEEMLETLKELQISRKKYSPIWYAESNINEEKIKEIEAEFEKISYSNEKIIAAQNMEFISDNLPTQALNKNEEIELEKEIIIPASIEPKEKFDGDLIIEKSDLFVEEKEEEKEIVELTNAKDLAEEVTLNLVENNENEIQPIISEKTEIVSLNETDLKSKNEPEKLVEEKILHTKLEDKIEVEIIENLENDNLEKINPSNIKEIIIEAPDPTHSFMEWLEILDGNITVSSLDKEAETEKIETDKELKKIDLPNESTEPGPISKEKPEKKVIKKEIKPKIKAEPKVNIEIIKPPKEAEIISKVLPPPSKKVVANLDERILPTKGRIIRDKEVDRRAVESISFNSALASETLALLYERQGKKIKAIEIYRILMVKNPKKKRFFASQIKKLESE